MASVKQNVTISISPETVRKAKILAARRSTSISGLLAEQLEILVGAIEDEAGIGFWDALIVAAARKAGALRILSEDLNAGQIISGIRIENPFFQRP